jgi:hypothetical protein
MVNHAAIDRATGKLQTSSYICGAIFLLCAGERLAVKSSAAAKGAVEPLRPAAKGTSSRQRPGAPKTKRARAKSSRAAPEPRERTQLVSSGRDGRRRSASRLPLLHSAPARQHRRKLQRPRHSPGAVRSSATSGACTTTWFAMHAPSAIGCSLTQQLSRT